MSEHHSLDQITTLYHFTDRRNIPMIRQLGGLLPSATLRKMGYKISHPGGNEWSHKADAMKGMDAYVHLCFRDSHPMEYQARTSGHIGDTIFLRIHAEVLRLPGVKFTSGVSNKSGVEACTIDKAIKLIDFDVLYTKTDWCDPNIQLRLRKAEKYEILVPQLIPLTMIGNMPNG